MHLTRSCCFPTHLVLLIDTAVGSLLVHATTSVGVGDKVVGGSPKNKLLSSIAVIGNSDKASFDFLVRIEIVDSCDQGFRLH